MKMNRIIVTLILLLTTLISFSQRYTPYIKFEKPIQSIGSVHEENGLIKVEYKFTNTGAKPLIIKEIKSSTQRLKVNWVKKPILPKKSGIVTLTYNPKKKNGAFNRTVTVISNAKNNVSILRISGSVIPRPLTLEEKYPLVLDELRFRKNENRIYFNNIKNTEKKVDTVHFLNYSDKEVKLSFKYLPKHVSVKIIPEILKPKQKGEMVIEFDATKTKEYGYTYERLPLKINEVYKYKNNLTVNAIIIEDFSKLTKVELEKAPKIKFSNTRFQFGSIPQGKEVTHKFYFENIGKSDLIIRKIKAGCGCTPFISTNRYIKPGEKSFVEVTFKSKNRRGRQHKFITFISNDPINHTIKLEVIGNITKPTK